MPDPTQGEWVNPDSLTVVSTPDYAQPPSRQRDVAQLPVTPAQARAGGGRRTRIVPLSAGHPLDTLSSMAAASPEEGAILPSEVIGGDHPILDTYQDVVTGLGKRAGQVAYNLGKTATDLNPADYSRGGMPEDWHPTAPLRSATNLLYGPADVERAFGPDPATHPGAEPTGEYGGLTDVLTHTNDAQRAGGLIGDMALLSLNPELAPGGKVAIESLMEGGRLSRLAGRGLEGLRSGVLNTITGAALDRQPGVGGGTGAALGFLMGPGKSAAQRVLGAEDNYFTRSADARVGRAISTTIKGNKVFVQQNAREIANSAKWFSTDALHELQDQMAARADAAGAKIDAAMSGARQSDLSGLLRSARTDLKTAVDSLRVQAGNGHLNLAPETQQALDEASQLLRSLNPKDTNITTLRQVHQTLRESLRSMQPEVAAQTRLLGLQGVGSAMDDALVRSRTGLRSVIAAAGDVRTLGHDLQGTRVETQPIIDALERAKNEFGRTNAAGRFVADVPEAVAHLTELQHNIAAYGPEMSADALRGARQAWDNVVAGATGKGWLGASIADESRRGTTKMGANILRGTLGDLVPAVRPANAEFHFAAGTRDAIADTLTRRTGHTGGLMQSLASLHGIGSLLAGGGGAALGHPAALLLPVMTALVKSPEFNLFSAKARLLVNDALRSGAGDKLRFALSRLILEAKLHEQGAAGPPVGMDLTADEAAHERGRLGAGLGLTPGITERANPDAVYADHPDPLAPAEPDLSAPQPGDADYAPETGQAPEDQSRLLPTSPMGGVHQAPVMQAGVGDVGGDNSIGHLLDLAQTPLLSAPHIAGNHPEVQKAVNAALGFTSPLDLGFAAEEGLRPLVAGTRAAPLVEGVGRGVAGTMALAGARNVQQGIERGSLEQAAGGGVQAVFGGMGMRRGGVAGVAGDVAEHAPGFADRLGEGLSRAGKSVVMGPALSMASATLGNSPAMRRLIPDDDTRHALMVGATVLGLAPLAATAYRAMTPDMKALTHAAGQLSLGRSEVLVRHELVPAITADVQARYPSWSPEQVTAKVDALADQAIAGAKDAVAKVDAASGGRAVDPRHYERMVDAPLQVHGDWYKGAKPMVQSEFPAQPGEAVDANGLTSKQAFGVDALATFGTNTPPKSNYDLFKEAADFIRQAPDGLTRPQLLQWMQAHAMPGGQLFGMHASKPGVPALRNIVTGASEGFGGRKIESYGDNLAQGTRPDITGRDVIPMTIDRWIYRAAGLPTEVPETTGEPVYRRDPQGNVITVPPTGRQRKPQPLVRGGDREVQQVERLGTNQTRFNAEYQRLRDQLDARVAARAADGSGPATATARELEALQQLATRNSQQVRVPTQKQNLRSTSVGSKWLGQSTAGNTSYEIIEQQLGRVGAQQGLTPDQVQAIAWYKTKLQSNISHGEAPDQGLPFDQQAALAKAHASLVTLPPNTPPAQRARATKELIDERNKALVKTLSANVTGPDSGFSHVVATDKNPWGDPVTAVSIYPERQVIVPRAVRANTGSYSTALAAFIRNNADLLQDPNLAVGGWVVKSPTAVERRGGKVPMRFGGRELPEGTLVLDVVALPSNTQNNAIAKSLGMEYLQDSVFDLQTGTNVKTGGLASGRQSPAAVRAAVGRKPGLYDRVSSSLDPATVPGRLAGLKQGAGSAQQRQLLAQWEAEQAAQSQSPVKP